MDLIDFFDDHGIEYWKSGNNVSRGCINIQCPFCDDHSNHLGIRKKDFKVRCWRCGSHNIEKVVQEISGITYKEAKLFCSDLSLGVTDTNPPVEKYASSLLSTSVQLPQESTRRFPQLHIDYLISRGFKPNKINRLIRKYKLRACYNTSCKYKFRIIIPIIQNRNIISFTSRTVVKGIDPRYKDATNKPYKKNGKIIQDCMIEPKHLVYNIDTVTPGSDAILVEGPVDVWKLGNNAIALLGTNYTEDQIIIIKRKSIRNLFILFDSDRTGRKKARAVTKVLAPLVRKVEDVTLTKVNDPGELKEEEAEIVRNQLGIE